MKKILLVLILAATICGCREPQPTPKPIPPKDDDKKEIIIKDDGKIITPPVIYSEK